MFSKSIVQLEKHRCVTFGCCFDVKFTSVIESK